MCNEAGNQATRQPGNGLLDGWLRPRLAAAAANAREGAATSFGIPDDLLEQQAEITKRLGLLGVEHIITDRAPSFAGRTLTISGSAGVIEAAHKLGLQQTRGD